VITALRKSAATGCPGYRGVTGQARGSVSGRLIAAWGPAAVSRSPERGATVGVTWGESVEDHRRAMKTLAIRDRIERWAHGVWHRLFAHDGKT
jgi:hypothetical protein